MVDDTPDDLVFELHNAALWGEHPYGYSILGTRDTVAALGTDDLKALHERAYQPGQVVVAAAGNVRHEQLLETLERAGWARVPRGTDGPLVPPTPVAAAPGVHHVENDTAQVHVVFGSPTVSHGDPRRYAVGLVSMLLGGGMSSRLFQRVREELGLVYAVYSYQSFHVDTGVHGVYLATSPEQAEEATVAVRDELRRLANDGIPAAELEMGKMQLKGQITLSLEGVSSRMYRAAATELYGERFRPLDEILALVDAIDADTVNALCRDFFDPDRQAILSLGPTAAVPQ